MTRPVVNLDDQPMLERTSRRLLEMWVRTVGFIFVSYALELRMHAWRVKMCLRELSSATLLCTSRKPSALVSPAVTSADLCPLPVLSKCCDNSHQGNGVFATQAICAHEMVLEYVGEVLGLSEAKNRFAMYNRDSVMVSESGGLQQLGWAGCRRHRSQLLPPLLSVVLTDGGVDRKYHYREQPHVYSLSALARVSVVVEFLQA